jgi:NAD(P)-dependent dehydrogenase (short-subunit alcohol dehydrogenase family)
MIDQLHGKVAVVTGGASGIGLALAQRFGAEGMRLVIADVEEGVLDEATENLRDNGLDVIALRCDVSRAEDIERLAEQTYDAYGACHVLCNNAGVVHRALAWEQTVADWEWVLGVDLWGVIHGLRAFVPRMLAGGEVGHIVNTASTAGLMAFPSIASYDVAKAGVVALSECLCADLGSVGAPIGVSVLCPGVVRTRIYESERNRPDAGAAAQFTSGSQRAPETIGPEVVADHVVRAIQDERFWILPHPRYGEIVLERARSIAEGGRPVFGYVAGM